MKQLWDRWAPLTGLLSVACSLVGVMLALNQPQDKDSNAKIAAYFANHSHRVLGVVGFFVFLAGILLLLAFLAALRERLLAAEGQPGRLSALAFGAGIASLPLWAVSMLLANATRTLSGSLQTPPTSPGSPPSSSARSSSGQPQPWRSGRAYCRAGTHDSGSSPESCSCSGSSSSLSSSGGSGSSSPQSC